MTWGSPRLAGAPGRSTSEVGAAETARSPRAWLRGCAPDVVYIAVETSPGPCEPCPQSRASRSRSGWRASHVVSANELLDNLPFRRLRGTRPGRGRSMVALDGDRLVEELADAARRPRRGSTTARSVTPGRRAFGSWTSRPARPPRLRAADRLRRGGRAGRPAPHGYRGTDRSRTSSTGRAPRHHLRRRLRAYRGSRGARRPRRVPVRHPAARAHRPRLRPMDPGGARDAGHPTERRRRSRRGPHVERQEPGDDVLVDPSALGRFRWLLLGAPERPRRRWIRDRPGLTAGSTPK